MGAVRDFLSTNKVSQLPLRRGKVYEATTSMDLRAAFDLLVNNRILSVPVWDEETKTYIGMLTVRDLVSFAVFATAENNAVKTLEDILRHGVGHFGLAQDAVTVSYLARRNPFRPLTIDASLLDVCTLLSAGLHRVPIVDENGRVINIVSQSLLNEYLHAHAAELGSFTSKTIAELNIGTSPVLTVNEQDTALNVFRTLERSGRSGIAVVGPSGRLTGVTSGSDLKLFLANQESLNQPIIEFLKHIRQADLKTRALTFVCLPEHSIAHVMGMLKATQAHRLFVVDANHHAQKVVSILDILRCAMQN